MHIICASLCLFGSEMADFRHTLQGYFTGIWAIYDCPIAWINAREVNLEQISI